MDIHSRNSVFFQSLPRPFAVVGLGVTGRSVLRLLENLGVPSSDILTLDESTKEKGPGSVFGDPALLMSKKPQTLVVSPGVPLSLAWIQSARAQGVRITSELEIAFSFLTSEKVIAVTGSIGKSTTTSLIGAAAKHVSPASFVGGNLGIPLSDYVSDVLEGKALPAPWVVLELSSYQLENFKNLECEYSVFTFLTPNHLERYPSLEEYYRQKLSLLPKTKRLAIFNARGGDLSRVVSEHGSSFKTLAASKTVDRSSPVMQKLLPVTMIGSYNLDNIALAATIAEDAGWPGLAFRVLKEFSGLAHRLENLGRRQDILFINDSKATTIESVLQAVTTAAEGLSAPQRLWLLLGGHDKGLPWETLRDLSKSSIQIYPLFFGEFGPSAKTRTQLEGPVYATLAQALEALPTLCRPGDTVLLSPGGTSHDEFKNFEDRGHFFRRRVSELFRI